MTEKGIYLYELNLNERFTGPQDLSPEDLKIVEEHSNFLDKLGEKGQLVFAGRTMPEEGADKTFGLSLVRADSVDEVLEMIKGDPALVNNIMKVVAIYPFSLGIRHFRNLPQ